MKVYSVSYDLKGTNRDYTRLIAALQSAGKWWHFLESTWLIATDEAPAQLWKRVASAIQKRDFLMIIEVRNNVSGWLPKEAWDWIRTNVPAP
jgi:hypothetical protein